MSDEVTFKLINFDELDRILSGLDMKMQRKVKSKALRAGAKVVLEQARENVPEYTGNLKKSLGVSVGRFMGDVEARVLARKGKNRQNDGWYAHFLEFGTEKQAAQPFLRPAAEDKAPEAITEVGNVIMQEILKGVKE